MVSPVKADGKQTTSEDFVQINRMPDDNKFLKIDDLFDPKTSSSAASVASEKPKLSNIKKNREELEKGIVGLNFDIKKIDEELKFDLSLLKKEQKSLNEEFFEFKKEFNEELGTIKEELHHRFTEFKAHINRILLEYRQSISIIQSHVDSQLIVGRRDRTDTTMILDTLIKRSRFQDNLSLNYYNSMSEISQILNSVIEVININFHLQSQDEKDRESIALMGLTQNTSTIDYRKNSEVPPISLDNK